jgi:MerR family transcriptional regulator/heat shock protein HspR
MYGYDEPIFLISVVAKVLKIHPQTLRQYEREGLIIPSRTEGKMRLYSQRDIDKIKTILRLTRELGVNLAGVDIILRLKEQISKLEEEIDGLKLQLAECQEEGFVPKNRAVVSRGKGYEVIIFDE